MKAIFPVVTNIVIFEVGGRYSSKQLAEKLKELGVLAIAISPLHVRFVTHLDINLAMINEVSAIIEAL